MFYPVFLMACHRSACLSERRDVTFFKIQVTYFDTQIYSGAYICICKYLYLMKTLFGILNYVSILCAIVSCGVKSNDSPRHGQEYIDSLVYADRSIDSLSVLVERFAKEENLLGEVVACRELGKAYRNATRYEESVDVHKRGLAVAEEICDTLQVIQALNNIGTAYRRMGMLDEAALWHYRALSMCDEWSMRDNTALKNRVVSLNGIGNIHLSLGEDERAMKAFVEALEGETRLGSRLGMAINCANIGALFEAGGQPDSARYYYSLSMRYNEEIGSELGISLCHNHFGRLAEKDGDYETALREYKASYDAMHESPDKWHWLESCISLARVNMKVGRYAETKKYLHEAEEVAADIDSPEHLVEIYHIAYSLEKSEGRYANALKYLERFSESKDSFQEEKRRNDISELRAGYEREKSRTELRMLQEEHMQKAHRDRMIILSSVAFLFLALTAVFVLAYAFRLRSRNNRMLKELDETKNNYFTNVAHEFRTPITVIRSAASEIFRSSPDDSSVKDDASDILKHSDSLLNLVNQVLDITRMTSSIAPAPVWRHGNIVAYVHDECRKMHRYAEEKGVWIRFDSDRDVVDTDFVPDMMRQIVQNLLSNAIKISDRGDAVSVSMCLSDDGRSVLISVKDTGIGMTEEQIKDAFRPFYRADGGFRNVGSGIGLAVVKLSAESMGGSVSVRSEVGAGSVFDVTIPLKSSAVATESVAPLLNVDSSVLEQDAIRILIVEDSPEVARWEMRQLGPEYAFWFASDGAEGLRKAEDIVPDLIITDVMMPVMDGVEMCRRIRASELLCHVPVIMVTAKAAHDDRLQGLEAGADAYLEKPYDEKELALRVRMLLDQRRTLKEVFANGEFQAGKVQDDQVGAGRSFLKKVDDALEAAFAAGKVDCEALASSLCIGRVQLNRKMKAVTGYKTTEYIQMARLSKAKQLLKDTDLQIGEIAIRCGIDDVGYFSTLFKKGTGLTPTAFRNS